DRRRRADDQRGAAEPAPARGRGDRWRLPRPCARQCAVAAGRLLHRAEGGRMTALTDLTIAAARDLLARGEISAVELTEAHLAAMAARRDLNAFILETPERALDDARAS